MAVVFDFDEPWHLGEVFTFEDSGEWRHEPRTSPSYEGSGIKLGFGIFPVKGGKIKMHATTPFWDEDVKDPSDPSDDVPRERKQYYADIKEVAFSLAFAMRITEWLSIGVAPSFIWGEINENAPLAQPVSILKGHPGGGSGSSGPTYADLAPFTGISSGEIVGFSKIQHARTYGGRVRFGALFVPNETVSIGISYATPSFSQDYLGKGHVDFSRQIRKIDDPDLVKAAIAADTGIPPEQQTFIGECDVRLKPNEQPHEVSIGIAFRFDYVAFGADVTWFNWSATHDEFEARLTNCTSGELNELTGDEKDTVHAGFPLDWKDQIVFAFGVAVQPADWLTIRAGYNYGKSPIPDDTLQPTLPAITEHHFTAGLSLYWRRLEFTLNFEHDVRAKQEIEDSRVNSDLNGTEVDIQIQFIAFGVGVRF
jgi:long-subunit fatty acid transport protein